MTTVEPHNRHRRPEPRVVDPATEPFRRPLDLAATPPVLRRVDKQILAGGVVFVLIAAVIVFVGLGWRSHTTSPPGNSPTAGAPVPASSPAPAPVVTAAPANPADSAPADSTTSAPATPIHYEVGGDAADGHTGGSISYSTNGHGGKSQANGKRLPWISNDISVDDGFGRYSITAQTTSGADEATISCSIMQGSKVLDEQTVNGPYAVATCSANMS